MKSRRFLPDSVSRRARTGRSAASVVVGSSFGSIDNILRRSDVTAATAKASNDDYTNKKNGSRWLTASAYDQVYSH